MESVTIQTLEEEMKNEVQIVDVREQYEFEEGHVPTAKNIPLSQLEDRYREIEEGSYIICRSGSRSMNACLFLKSKGISTINVSGGTLAWKGCLIQEECEK